MTNPHLATRKYRRLYNSYRRANGRIPESKTRYADPFVLLIYVSALSISGRTYYAAIDFPHPISMSSQTTRSDNVNPIS